MRHAVFTGFLTGILALIRTNAITLLPAISIWMLFRKRGWRQAAAFLVPAVALLSLVPIRNYLVTSQWILTPTEGPVTLVLGNNMPRDTDIASALTGVAARDQLFRQGLDRLLEFDHNPSATYDPFAPGDNARMSGPLLRVWIAYVMQHPTHYLHQAAARTWSWFFSGWHIVSLLSAFALVGVAILVRDGRNPACWSLYLNVAAYSLPFWIAYFEPRHRAVILPELTVLAFFALASLVQTFLARVGTGPHQNENSRPSCLAPI
jgi:hypothetical protein